MSKLVMFLAGILEIIAGLIFLFVVKLKFIAVFLFIAGALFIISGLLTAKAESDDDDK